MKKTLIAILGLLAFIGLSRGAIAHEHGGKEHGGETRAQEQGGTPAVQQAASAPSNDDIRSAMQTYVAEEAEKTNGNFEVLDPDTNTTRKLQMLRVHERVGKTGNYYYSCADFKDVDTGEMLDLDLDVEDEGGKLDVEDVRIHKVNGQERYTYDENDNRIPLMDTKSHLGSEADAQEHAGQ